MKYNWNEETVQHFKFESFYEVEKRSNKELKNL